MVKTWRDENFIRAVRACFPRPYRALYNLKFRSTLVLSAASSEAFSVALGHIHPLSMEDSSYPRKILAMTSDTVQPLRPDSDLDPADDPIAQIQAWLAEAEKTEINDPNAMNLATVGADGRPSARMVLLKGIDARGFVFYTNFESRKGQELLANPFAALTLH